MDLSLDKHVSNVCATCFYWLRQLRRIRRSLDTESTKSLVHAFVTSRVDYCNSVLAGAPSPRLTSFNVCWILQHVLSLVRESLTMAYLICVTTTSTGRMFPSESSTSWEWLCIAVYDIRLHGTWSTAAHQSLTSLAASVSALPVVIGWWYHDIGAACSAVGLSLLLVRRSGTRCQSTFEIWRSVLITLLSHWKRGCLEDTSVLSGLEVIHDYPLYKSTFYLLTLYLTFQHSHT